MTPPLPNLGDLKGYQCALLLRPFGCIQRGTLRQGIRSFVSYEGDVGHYSLVCRVYSSASMSDEFVLYTHTTYMLCMVEIVLRSRCP